MTMRKIVLGLFISLDGVVQGPGPADDFEYAGWTMPYYSDEVGEAISGNMASSDTLLLGRKTFQGFQAAFAGQSDDPFADYINNVRKVVASNTLQTTDWNNSLLLKGDVAGQVKALKEAEGRDISISGSVAFAQFLMQHNLIDEYSLLVYPVVLGKGQRLFPDGFKSTLELVESRPLSNGVVHMTYRTAGQ
jgi:dihydrofolate reductase